LRCGIVRYWFFLRLEQNGVNVGQIPEHPQER
jgi:hypothetical protein